MSIETRCDHCSTILTAADENAGRLARCPNCQAEYTIPVASDDAALDAVCHFCGAAVPRGQTDSEEFLQCSDCAESISENQLEIAADEQARQKSSRLLITAAVIGGLLYAATVLVSILGKSAGVLE